MLLIISTIYKDMYATKQSKQLLWTRANSDDNFGF